MGNKFKIREKKFLKIIGWQKFLRLKWFETDFRISYCNRILKVEIQIN